MRINLCRYCGKQFKARRGKFFCSDACRVTGWRETTTACIYCGLPATSIDHIPPQMVRPLLIEHGVTKWQFLEVPACVECNTWLGARQPWVLADRKKEVKEHLRRKYGPYLAAEDWTDEEIADLGRGLYDFITESRILARLVRQRLSW